MVTQTLARIQSLALALLTLTKRITILEIIWLSAFQGAIKTFDMPGRQTFLVQMVEDRQDLGNAIALNSSMVNRARLVGPSSTGAVIALSGEGYCFLIDGISCLAVIASLGAMRLKSRKVNRTADFMLAQLKEGWTSVSSFAPIRPILLLFALVALMGWPFTILMPIFAAKILRGGPHTLGFLMGGCRSRGPSFGAIACRAQDGGGIRQNNPAFDGGLRRRFDLFRNVADFGSHCCSCWSAVLE